MTILLRYFPFNVSKYDKNFTKDVTEYNNKNNQITSLVDNYKVEINIIENEKLNTNCTCNKANCIHVYKTLLLKEYKLKNKQKNIIKNIEDIKEKSVKYNKMGDIEVKNKEDEEKFLDYITTFTEFKIDTYANMHGFKQTKTIEIYNNNLSTIIFAIKSLLKTENYQLAFKTYKLIFEYIIHEEYFDIVVNFIIEQLKDLIDKIYENANKNLREELFTWILEIIQISPYNSLIEYIYNLSKRQFNRKEELFLKEELSMIQFQKISNTKYEKYEKREDTSWSINREKIMENYEEKEFWYNYHLSTLRKLNYTNEEINQFYKYTENYYLSRKQLKKQCLEENKNKELIELLKEDIKDPEINQEQRKNAINEITTYIKNYKESEEYLNTIKDLIFKEKITDDILIKDYTNLDSNWELDAEDLIKILEENKTDYKTLNRLYYRNYDKEKLLKSLKETLDISEIVKYENFLMEDYIDELSKIFINSYKIVNQLNDEDINLHKENIVHIKKYPNWKANLEELKEYYDKNYIRISKEIGIDELLNI